MNHRDDVRLLVDSCVVDGLEYNVLILTYCTLIIYNNPFTDSLNGCEMNAIPTACRKPG